MPNDAYSDPSTVLTQLSAKAERYSGEVYSREAWLDLQRATAGAAGELVHRHALVLFKPDGVASRAIMPSLGLLEEFGFVPVSASEVRFDRHVTRAMWLYRFNVASVERVVLHDVINEAGPALLVALRDLRHPDEAGLPASVRLTDAKGPSRPERRRPDQLRSRLGVSDRILNFLHTSDEPADVVREIGILLPSSQRRTVGAALATGRPWSEEVRDAIDAVHAATDEVAFDAAADTRDLLALADAVGVSDAATRAAACAGDAEALRRLWLALVEHPDVLQKHRWKLASMGSAAINFDEPGRDSQTVGDAPPALWRAAS